MQRRTIPLIFAFVTTTVHDIQSVGFEITAMIALLSSLSSSFCYFFMVYEQGVELVVNADPHQDSACPLTCPHPQGHLYIV